MTVSTMSSIPKKSLMLFSGRAHPELAEEIAKELDVTITPQSAYDFANGEIFVRFEESVRGSRRVHHPEPHRADQHSGSWSSSS